MDINSSLKEAYAAYLQQSKPEFWIGIQNFQSIREYTKIPLAPITLLYGQNSAGKSAVHDAWQFVCGFFSGEWDHATTVEHLNRWANKKREERPLTKGYLGKPDDVVIAVSGYADYWDFSDWADNHLKHDSIRFTSPLSDLFEMDQVVCFSLSINFWEFQYDKSSYAKPSWDVAAISLYLNGELFLSYSYNEDDTNYIDLNTSHMAYKVISEWYNLKFHTEVSSISFPELSDGLLRLKECPLFCNPVGDANLSFRRVIDRDGTIIDSESHPEHLLDLFDGLIGIPAFAASRRLSFNSLPPLREIPARGRTTFRIGSLMNPKLDSCWHILSNGIRSGSSPYFLTSKLEEKKSEEMLCNGSVDEMAKALTECFLTEYEQRENDIKNMKTTFTVISHVNRLLCHSDFLNTGYEIIGDCKFIVPAKFFSKDSIHTPTQINFPLELFDAEVDIRLRYVPGNYELELEDVGVGISQVIPVLVALASNYRVYFQQPELHLHPKLQAQLADAFIEPIKDEESVIFVIESHSEHFLLRLLRRIRETSRSDIKNRLFNLTPEQLCVLFVDKDAEGESHITRLRVAENGEFIDRWPNGFFTERDEDLFYE